jgi:hypothetical protein
MLEKFSNKYKPKNILLICDVQKSFNKFFTPDYVSGLDSYCNDFHEVYQLWDNHVDGKRIPSNYLYKRNHPEASEHEDLYQFNKQTKLIEKRYNYRVDATFYSKILDYDTLNKIKSIDLKPGIMFDTTKNTKICFIGNNHRWFHCPVKLYETLLDIKQDNITLCGGAEFECLHDIYVLGKALGLNIKKNRNHIYDAKNCPVK